MQGVGGSKPPVPILYWPLGLSSGYHAGAYDAFSFAGHRLGEINSKNVKQP